MKLFFIKNRFRASVFLFIAVALLLRLAAWLPTLEFDEIWTCLEYATSDPGKIFTELATPNNHPLSSLLILFCAKLFPEPLALSARIPSFLAGILTVPLIGVFALRLFRSRLAACYAMGFCALSAPLIRYSVTARGYALQTFLILLFAYFALMHVRTGRTWYLYCIPVAGMLAVLTLPTSIFWLIPLSLCFLWIQRRDHKVLLHSFLSCGVMGAFVLFWFLKNYDAFRKGQVFGEALDSVWAFSRFSYETLCTFSGSLFLILLMFSAVAAFFLRRKRRMEILMLGVVAFSPLVLSILTKAGPPRVYLASLPFLFAFWSVSLLWGKIGKRFALVFLCSLLIPFGMRFATLNFWTEVDWSKEYKRYSSLPETDFYIISPLCSLPLAWNNGEKVLDDYFVRFQCFGGQGSRVILQERKNLIPGETEDHSEKWIPFSGNTAEVTTWKPGDKNEILLLKYSSSDLAFSDIFKELERECGFDCVLLLNSRMVTFLQELRKQTFAIILCQKKDGENVSPRFLRFYDENLSRIGFYALNP